MVGIDISANQERAVMGLSDGKALPKTIQTTVDLVQRGIVSSDALRGHEHIHGEAGALITHARQQGEFKRGLDAALGPAGPFGPLVATTPRSDDRTPTDRRTLGASTDTTMLMAAATEQAMKSGLAWAVEKPELLQLGPEAIKALAAVNLTEQSFDKLKEDAGFTAQDTVDLAKFAKRKDIDANRLSTAFAGVAKGLDETEKKDLRETGTALFRDPDSRDKLANFQRTLDHIQEKHPEKAAAVAELREIVPKQEATKLEATAARNQSLDAFNASPSSSAPAQPTPSAPPTP